jgi:nitrile hydratase
MTQPTDLFKQSASVEKRVDAIQSLMQERGMEPAAFIDEFRQTVEERWVAENGARVVAKAWTDPATVGSKCISPLHGQQKRKLPFVR